MKFYSPNEMVALSFCSVPVVFIPFSSECSLLTSLPWQFDVIIIIIFDKYGSFMLLFLLTSLYHILLYDFRFLVFWWNALLFLLLVPLVYP